MPTPRIRTIAPKISTIAADQRFMGLEIGTRMTLIELHDGLLVHSPIGINPDVVRAIGEPRWVVAPNLFHHLYVGPWIESGAEGWCPAGLPEKRPDVGFQGVLTETGTPFGDDLLVIPMTCMSMTNEVVLLHRPSRTLIVTDLVFNLAASAPLSTRLAFRALGGYPGCKTTALERFAMKRDRARQEIAFILSQDFDRVVMAHGDVIETDGKSRIEHAFQWLR